MGCAWVVLCRVVLCMQNVCLWRLVWVTLRVHEPVAVLVGAPLKREERVHNHPKLPSAPQRERTGGWLRARISLRVLDYRRELLVVDATCVHVDRWRLSAGYRRQGVSLGMRPAGSTERSA